MITALIRTHPGREESTVRAIKSAQDEGLVVRIYYGETKSDYSYNLYCNILKDQVTEGYFFFLDSDDFVIKGSVAKIIPYLEEDVPLIVQMLRNGRPKPKTGLIERGKIGLPCIVMHSKHKDKAIVLPNESGDFDFIKGVTDQIGYEFVPIPLVDAGKRGRGK